MKQEDYLIQEVKLIKNDKILDLSFLKEATFVETIDLSGPRLMMLFDDFDSIIRDEIGVKERDLLEIRLADVWARDNLDKTLRFTILTMPNEGPRVKLNCMQADIVAMKQPAKDSILFTRKPVESIVRRLAPGLKYEIGSFPALEDYHLLPGGRPTKLLRQIAREQGAVCFFRRGTIVFKKPSELLKVVPKVPDHVYEYDNPTAPNQIAHFTRVNAKSVLQDRIERNIIGWDMTKGLVKSGKKTTAPPEFVSLHNMPTMNNLTDMPYPAIDFTALGNGLLVPGMTLKLVWNTAKDNAPIDESLPAKVIIGVVAHHYSAQKYRMRVKGVLPL